MLIGCALLDYKIRRRKRGHRYLRYAAPAGWCSPLSCVVSEVEANAQVLARVVRSGSAVVRPTNTVCADYWYAIPTHFSFGYLGPILRALRYKQEYLLY